ncbi:MAG: glycosyltransferase family 2 protein [Acidimicrobiales bacterium]
MVHNERNGRSLSGALRRSRRLSVIGILLFLLYLGTRASTVGSGWILALSLPLFVAEVAAFFELSLLAFHTWSGRSIRRDPTPGSALPAELMIDVHGHGSQELERTLVALATLEPHQRPVTTTVVDSSHRRDVIGISKEFGAEYVVDPRVSEPRAQAIHEHSRSPLYVRLDAGQVPMPDMITALARRFTDPWLAICQASVGLMNGDSLVHIQRGRDETALERDVLAPALDRHGAVPWLGAPAMVRRSAIDEVGGLPGGHPATFERTVVKLQSAGWRSGFEPSAVVRTIAPDTLDEYLEQRVARSVRALQIFRSPQNPIVAPGLSRTQRLAHLGIASRVLPAVRYLVVAIVLVATLITGRLPFDSNVVPIAGMWVAVTAVSTAARRSLVGDAMKTGDWVRQGWRTLGADLAAIGLVASGRSQHRERARIKTRGGIRSLGKLRLLTAIVAAIDLALLVRALSLIDIELLPAFPSSERVVVLTFGLIALVPMIDVLQLMVGRRQRRHTFRLKTSLDVELGETAARTVDLSTSGVGLLMSFAPPIGSTTPIRLRLPDRDEADRWINGTAIVRAANPDRSGLVRVGLEFAHLDDAARRALLRYCVIGDTTLDLREAMITPEAEPHRLDTNVARGQHRSLRSLTGVAAVAGIVTIFAGASPVAAAEIAVTSAEEVCLTLADGLAVPEASVEVKTAGGWESIAVTGRDGCSELDDLAPDATLALTKDAVRREFSPLTEGDGVLHLTMARHAIRVTSSEGTGVNDVSVRWFTDQWHNAEDTDPAGLTHVDSLTSNIQVEVTWRGGRVILPMTDGGVQLELARIDSGGAAAVEIDRGNGWEPFHDGVQVMPGRVAIRLADGSTIKTEVAAGHILDLATGLQIPSISAATNQEDAP